MNFLCGFFVCKTNQACVILINPILQARKSELRWHYFRNDTLKALPDPHGFDVHKLADAVIG